MTGVQTCALPISVATQLATATSQVSGVGPYEIKIPQGNFTISGPVHLPSGTTLIGEGSGKTIITMSNGITNEPLFSSSDITDIKFSGMTLLGSDATTLISLYNAKNAVITDVDFGDVTASDTSTNIGIKLGSDTSGNDAMMANSANIRIDNCKFNALDRAV